MCRQFEIENVLLALATFGLGVLSASIFSSAPLSPAGKEIAPDIRYSSEICIATRPSDSERRMYHTERERMLVDRIRGTEMELLEVRRRNGIFSQEVERETSARQRRLEERLQMLLSQREQLLREWSVDPPKELNGSKPVYRECYER